MSCDETAANVLLINKSQFQVTCGECCMPTTAVQQKLELKACLAAGLVACVQNKLESAGLCMNA
jgi:hypothetical protein